MVVGKLIEMLNRFLHRSDDRDAAVKADVERTEAVKRRVDYVLDQFHYANGVSNPDNLHRRRDD